MVWSHLGPRLSTVPVGICEVAAGQPQAPRSKLQETSGGGQRRVSTPDTSRKCREAGGDWPCERGSGAPGGGPVGGQAPRGSTWSLPPWLRGLQPVRVMSSTLRPAARGHPRPPSPTSSSHGHEGGGCQPGLVPRGLHPRPPLLTRNGRRRPREGPCPPSSPQRCCSRACHTSFAAAAPSTTTSQLQEACEGHCGRLSWPLPLARGSDPHPRTGQRVQGSRYLGGDSEDSKPGGAHEGPRGQGGCEYPASLGQLPPGPLYSQEVPWGEQASELVPPRDPDPAPSPRGEGAAGRQASGHPRRSLTSSPAGT